MLLEERARDNYERCEPRPLTTPTSTSPRSASSSPSSAWRGSSSALRRQYARMGIDSITAVVIYLIGIAGLATVAT
jgi:hypothetical protein